MDAIPRGKIGRLSPDLREQVNRRMERHEPAARLLAWLNAQPEVQALLAAEFKNKPITEQNLSLWRKFGFRDWILRREAQDMAAELGQMPAAGNSNTSLTAQLSAWGTVRYQMAVRELIRQPGHTHSRLNTMRDFTRDLIALRRADHREARLQFQQQRSKRYDKPTCLPKDAHSSEQ